MKCTMRWEFEQNMEAYEKLCGQEDTDTNMARIGCRTCVAADYTSAIHQQYVKGAAAGAVQLQKESEFHPDIPWRILNFGGRADGPRGCTPTGKDCDEWRKQQCWGENLVTQSTEIFQDYEGAKRLESEGYDPYAGRPFCGTPTQRTPYATPVPGGHMCDRYYAAAGRLVPSLLPAIASLLAALFAYLL